jgi:hypothetical protein
MQDSDAKHPATKNRGGDPDMKAHPARDTSKEKAERKLEQGLEESMAGSDPPSITQPAPSKSEHEKTSKDEDPSLAKDDALQYRAGRAQKSEDKH